MNHLVSVTFCPQELPIKKILIIDDIETNSKIMAIMLKDYECHAACSGIEGLEKMKSFQPDLILLDVMMPGMDGYEVCEKICSEPAYSRIPIIMVTAVTDQKSRIRGLKAGARDFLTKPVDMIELRVRVANLLALKDREELLAHQFEFLQTITDTVPSPVFYKDKAGIYLGCNKAFEQLVGLPKNKIVGEQLNENLFRAMASQYEDMDHALLECYSGIMIHETTIQRYDGTVREIIIYKDVFRDSKGIPTGIIGVCVDITERVYVEQALKESQELYQALIEQSSDGIYVYDPMNFGIREGNAHFLLMLGYSKEELSHLVVSDIVMDTQDVILDSTKQVLLKGTFSVGIRQYRRKDGSKIWVDVVASAILHRKQQVILVNLRDITEEKRLEEEILRDVELAAIVQRSFLPPSMSHERFEIKGIYAPYKTVSGDLYDYIWNPETEKLFGFIVDISGHGVATSIRGSAVTALIRQAGLKKGSLAEKIGWVNRNCMNYFTEESFAAAILFEFDFKTNTLTYASAGITTFFVRDHGQVQQKKVPGFPLGITLTAIYDEEEISFASGSYFYFMSDGISDLLTGERLDVFLAESSDIRHVEWIEKLAQCAERRDDASSLCIGIK